MSDPFVNRDDAPFINVREMNRPAPRPKAEPQIDPEVSKIVGRPIRVNDPLLVREVIKWRQSGNPDKMDNHLQNKNKQADLRRIFGSKTV